MRKLPTTVFDGPAKPRSKASTVMLILTALILAPLVYEASALCAARWKAMFGVASAVETPIIDAVSTNLQVVIGDLKSRVDVASHTLPWKPGMVLPFIIAVTLVATTMLRGRSN